MKKSITLFTLLIISMFLKSQNLQNVSIYPANPTSADHIKVIGNLMFTSGGCDMLSNTYSVNSNQIDVEVKHCTGFLAVICYTTDTIDIGNLPAGNYLLNFSALTGSFDFSGNCTNFQSGGQQSIQFQVSGTTGYSKPRNHDLNLSYDNAGDRLIVSGNTQGCQLRLIDILGHNFYDASVSEGPLPIKSTLHKGIYVYSFKYPNGEVRGGRLFIH
ncbi:MAG: hypothetical protein ACKOKF_10025 [Bacteroidota bacterium]